MASLPSAQGFTLERHDDGQKLYFSLERGPKAPATAGWWSTEQKQALQFSRTIDAQRFMDTYLPHMAQLVQIRQVPAEQVPG